MVSHVALDILALRALGERAGAEADDAHLPGCAHCQAELGRLAGVVTLGRQDNHADQLFSPPARVWTRITRELGPEGSVALQPGPALQPDLSPEPGPERSQRSSIQHCHAYRQCAESAGGGARQLGRLR
jgi:hypothetical protein